MTYLQSSGMNTDWSASDCQWMQLALDLARRAAACGEVPVGAVVVRDGELLGSGHNRPVTTHDPSAHAEIVALRQAAARVGNYRLSGATVYVTLEPCPMCAGAMLHARVARVVAGAGDSRGGAGGSVVNLFTPGLFNHTATFEQGLEADTSSDLLKAFFKARRRS
jgi:tRNA(adenine34) deaminase